MVLYSRQKLKVLKNKLFLKKNSSSLFALIRFSNRCADVLTKKIDLEIFYLSVILRFEKLFLTVKLLTRRKQQKIKKILHTLLKTNISQINLVKFLKYRIKPWRTGARRVSTGYYFLKQICWWRFYNFLFNSSCIV